MRHLCDKAIASAGHRLNAASPNSPLIEHPAKRPGLSGQVAVGYGQSGPDRAEDFVLGHEISAARYQQNQQLEGAGAERHRDKDTGVIALEESAGRGAEAKALEKKMSSTVRASMLPSLPSRERRRR